VNDDEMKSTSLGVAIVASLALCACGISASKVSNNALRTIQPTPILCQIIPRIDRLTVTRLAPGNEFTFSLPGVVDVTNSSLAREVASSACALPDTQPGVLHCPAAFAVSYRLDFDVKGVKGFGGEVIYLYPTGCQTITNLGSVRTTSSDFYRQLAQAMGFNNGNNLTFSGTPRAGV